jgi:hypothetical protein
VSVPVALILGGAIVYLQNDTAGALMIAAGCTLELVKWLSQRLSQWSSETKHESTHEA